MRIIESNFKKLYQEYLDSGLSVRDFCTNQNFAVSTFYNWKKKLALKESTLGFVPLLVDNQPMVRTNTHPEVALRNDELMTQENDLEFIFPNGTKLQVKGNVDLALLKNIVHLY